MDTDLLTTYTNFAKRTISDLKDDYFDGINLSKEEREAINTFEKYKVKSLEGINDDIVFQQEYFKLQILENTNDFHDFLNIMEVD